MGCGASRPVAPSHSPRSLSAAEPLACGEFRRFVKASWDESPQGPLLIEFIDALDGLHHALLKERVDHARQHHQQHREHQQHQHQHRQRQPQPSPQGADGTEPCAEAELETGSKGWTS